MSKKRTEEDKARKAYSKPDLQDLDHSESEGGTTFVGAESLYTGS